jgi:hypothetical protein
MRLQTEPIFIAKNKLNLQHGNGQRSPGYQPGMRSR